MPHRRTVSIDDVIHFLINNTRSQFLQYNIDVDYTRALNMLLALGLRYFNTQQWDPYSKLLIMAYVSNNKLEISGKIDELQDKYIENVSQLVSKFLDESNMGEKLK